ncbi:MAG TPA: serine hydrolase domain-containing protein [Acidobacteriota bacterium]|nr:serine hydrolase domain-containing protein [Acidobacteriota bacterium]
MNTVTSYCEDCIQRRLFPGCAIAFGKSSSPPEYLFAGRITYHPDASAVGLNTWYDLASLTKPIATVTAAMQAVRQERLTLETPVRHFFPHIRVPEAEIRHLLSHSSGLPAYRPFFYACRNGEEVIEAIIDCDPEYPAGSKSVYSDLGYMLLGRILEQVFDQTFRNLVQEQVLLPLRLDSIQFGPPLESSASTSGGWNTTLVATRLDGAGQAGSIAPTELDFRLHGYLQGIVHDENARLFGGAAGHAGIFGKIAGVARFAQLVLAAVVRGANESSTPAMKNLVQFFRSWTHRQAWLLQSSWGLGWDTPTPAGSAGPALGSNSFGHTGFTGASIWIDPDRELYICVLSNRVFPSRRTEGMKEARRQIHALVVEGMRG